MKPLSKRQREVLQHCEFGFVLVVINGFPFLTRNGFIDSQVHCATFSSLIKNGHIEINKGYYTITSSGLTALAKPTRNRGKKKKPVIENAHEKIMV